MRLLVPLILVLASLGPQAFADSYLIDGAHSSIEFKIRHLVSKVKGTFGRYEGTFDFDPAKPQAGKFDFKIDATSINTASEDRDKHLRSADFFDTEKFKEIRFVTRSITGDAKEKFSIQGDLTIKGKTCPITIDAQYAGEVKDPWGNTKAGFEGTTKVNRLAWGIVWNKALVGDKLPKDADLKDSCELNKNLKGNNDGAGLTLGTVVDIELHIEAENLTKKPVSPTK